MKKKMDELPPEAQARIRTLEALPEDQIDTSDAPEILDWPDARRGVFYRPVKQQITLRIDAESSHGSRLTPVTGATARLTSMMRYANVA